MVCVRCGKKLKLRNDGMRRCGSGCSEVMGIVLRLAAFPQQIVEQQPVQQPTIFKPRLKPVWKSC